VLCREILPELRARIAREVCVDLVGSKPASSIQELASISGVSVHADAADVGPFYRAANIAVVPLRAGGGTRVKILEAFAHGVPVVSTSIGAEGLRVVPDRHLLTADGTSGMVDACARLLGNPGLADRLRTDAHALVASEYEISIIVRRIRALLPVDATHPTFHNTEHGRELGAEEGGRPRGE
jgi:glycosyltransferase involved in cell wall biosynthesis